jgi:plastocyanin
MEPQSNDQQQFDAQVNRTGKLALEILAGVGVFAAVVMSTIALMQSTDSSSTTTVIRNAAAVPATQALPTSVSATIEHVTKGCHTLAVQGAAKSSPNATIHLATGGVLKVQDNDVMPHQLYRVSGPTPSFTGADMARMGARSSVTFPTAGTYVLSTKAGEDYMKGVQTIGEDNTLKIRVVVGGAPA